MTLLHRWSATWTCKITIKFVSIFSLLGAEWQKNNKYFQRSKDLASIRDNLERNPRNVFGIFGIQLVKDADGHGTVVYLIKVICDKDLLRKKYHFMTENCKQFAAEIFNSCSFGKCSVGLRPLVDLPHPCERDHEAAWKSSFRFESLPVANLT